MSDTKKLLRLGSDQPRCADCGTDDYRTHCRVRRGKRRLLIICRSCHAKRKRLSPRAAAQKAARFGAAGYVQPACVICTEPALRLLELDHLAGDANSKLTEPLCAKHHAIKSYEAEHGLMAALRLRDPQRSALLLQAAFEFGLAAILGMMAAVEGADNVSRAVFFGAVAVALAAWAAWNISADSYFEARLGPGYDRAIPATVPR